MRAGPEMVLPFTRCIRGLTPNHLQYVFQIHKVQIKGYSLFSYLHNFILPQKKDNPIGVMVSFHPIMKNFVYIL